MKTDNDKELVGRKATSAPTLLEVNGSFFTKPRDIANYRGDYFKKNSHFTGKYHF